VARPRNPNLLFLWSDQHRADVMPGPGNPVVRAPNLAKLAETSCVFERAYCAQPLCTPSRGSILTGLWPHRHGADRINVPLHAGARTIAEYLPPEYATGYFGKWHLGDELNPQHGFAEWRSIEDCYRPYYRREADRARRSDYHAFLLDQGFPPDVVEADGGATFSRNFAAALAERFCKATFLAQEAERFLEQRQDGQPFCLSVSFLEPHPPTFGPRNGEYDPASIPTDEAFLRWPGENASRRHRRRAELVKREGYKQHRLETETDWRRLRSNYYGLVTQVDAAVGRILRALQNSGAAEHTLVVYTSDHGDMLGDHCLVQKGVFYEAATRVPLLLRVPWQPGGKRVSAPFSHIDLAPTLLELMGAAAPTAIDGKSQAASLQGESLGEDVVVISNDPKHPAEDGRCLITSDGWKCNLYRDDAPELFDLRNDAAELSNVARRPEHRSRLSDLVARLRDWQHRTGDTLPLCA
jgi:arylsulfatase A-like enzyme